MIPECLARRPWLLVWGLFFLLIAAWAYLFSVTDRIPVDRLTPEAEARILEGRRP